MFGIRNVAKGSFSVLSLIGEYLLRSWGWNVIHRAAHCNFLILPDFRQPVVRYAERLCVRVGTTWSTDIISHCW
jgi:hypothetical protein